MSVRKDGSCYLNVGSEKAQPVDCKQITPRRVEIEERLKRAPTAGAGPRRSRM
jgi:biopolymer transport protein TolR